MRTAIALLIVLYAIGFWVLARSLQPEIQAASDRICVPLYSDTGMECCQR